MDRVILHSDLNNFYASVECMLNPNLQGKHVAVCGNKADRHGIVLAKNQGAKMLGVKTGEPIWQAKIKCPDLVIVPPQYDQYLKYSEIVRNIYYNFTDMIEPFGMDECWLDVSGCTKSMGSGVKIAGDIKEQVKAKTGLTVSVGVSYNKIFAKLGSDMKKPDAVTYIPKENYKEKVWPLDVGELLGVGYKTRQKLKTKNINTIGDLAAASPERLKLWLGVNGIRLWRYANGYDNSRVSVFDYTPPIKSIGHGITCVTDLLNNEEVWRVILELTGTVARRLKENKLEASGIAISVKDKNLVTKEYQEQLFTSTSSTKALSKAFFDLFLRRYTWKENVRAVSVRAINLVSANMPKQLSFFDDGTAAEKQQKLDKVADSLKSKYGKKIITYASLMQDLKMPPAKDAELILPSFYV